MDTDSKVDVAFDTLVGEHMLDAVDEDSTKVKQWSDSYEDAQVLRFRLDGVVYTAVENPEDGYRSCMDKMFISDDEMRNVFPPVKVLARIRDKYEYGGSATVLQLIDVQNGKVVLEVGTDNDDDYYACFVASWIPGNLKVNEA